MWYRGSISACGCKAEERGELVAELFLIALRQLAKGVLLTVRFGAPAANTAIVSEVVETLKSLALQGGPRLLIDGPASLPVAFVLAHAVSHLYAEVAVRDPKLQGFVVVVSHGGLPVGHLIPDSESGV